MGIFLAENKGVYRLKDEHIEVAKNQEVDGPDLLSLKAEDFERWGIPSGPAHRIVRLSHELKGVKRTCR